MKNPWTWKSQYLLISGHEAGIHESHDFNIAHGAQATQFHEEINPQQHDLGPPVQPATSYQNHQIGHLGGGYGNSHDFVDAHSFSGQADKSALSPGFSSSVGQVQRW